MKQLLSLFFGILILHCNAQTLSEITLEPFSSGFNNPVGIYNAGDARLFVIEQNQSEIEILDLDGNNLGVFLNISSLTSTGGERGLLGLAFHPDYANNGKFYVNYTNNSGNTVIAEYTVSSNPNVADASSGEVLMTIIQDFGNHNGGHIEFGPDGYLYIGMGDGGSGGDPNNRAQDTQSLLGKMLRIEVTGNGSYSVPSDNPFIGDANTLDEIWSTGLRNPWKFSFDAETGDLWIGDVGQGAYEEIDFEPAGTPGLNYGWRCKEGFNDFNTAGCAGLTLTDPSAEYTHSAPDNFCSITGGIVYRGSEYPSMQGHYFLTDYCAGSIFTLYPDGNGGFTETEVSSAGNFGYVAFGSDLHNELYLVDNGGQILKVTYPCDELDASFSFTGNELQASSIEVLYQWLLDGQFISGANSQSYTPTESGSYSLSVSNTEGCSSESFESVQLSVGGIYLNGCTNICASNYNPMAEVDDGSCITDENGCTACAGDLNSDGNITSADLTQFLAVFGTSCE